MIGKDTRETYRNHHQSSNHTEPPREEKRWGMEHLAKSHGKAHKRNGINQERVGEDVHGKKIVPWLMVCAPNENSGNIYI